MSAFISLVAIVTAAAKAQADALAWACGHQPQDGDTFNMPASSDGAEPVTHWFTRAQASPDFLALLQAAAQGQVPTEAPAGGSWSDYGFADAGAVLAVMAQMDTDVSAELDGAAHWQAVLADRGLQYVVQEQAL